MTQLPRYDAAQVATKTDIAELRAEIVGVNRRLDRLFLTLLAGSFGIVVSLIGRFWA